MSRDNFANQLAVYVSEAVVTAAVMKRQPFVIKAKQMQDCRLQVMNVNRTFCDVKAKLIGGAESDTALHAATSHPETKCLRMMITAL